MKQMPNSTEKDMYDIESKINNLKFVLIDIQKENSELEIKLIDTQEKLNRLEKDFFTWIETITKKIQRFN